MDGELEDLECPLPGKPPALLQENTTLLTHIIHEVPNEITGTS